MNNTTIKTIVQSTGVPLLDITNAYTIAALAVLCVIILAALSSITIEKNWKRSCHTIFKCKKGPPINTWYRIKRYILLTCLIVINGLLVVGAYAFSGQRELAIVLMISKAKDIICTLVVPISYLYRAVTCYHRKRPLLDGNGKTIVSIIPVYKEPIEEITYTMDSIVYNSIRLYQMVVVIICDGFVQNVDSVIDQKEGDIKDLKYDSWKGPDVVCEVAYGYRGKTPLVIIKKDRNMEKRDSLILAYDVFNQPRHNAGPASINFRSCILKEIKKAFNIDQYHYMFFTDADSFIEIGSLTSLIDELEYRNVTAACGLVVIDFEKRCGGFWNIYQHFQYLYGQYIRRNAENVIARITCLPGCITLVKRDSRLVDVITDYGTMPTGKDLIVTTIQKLGTDRRLAHLFQYYQLRTCMVLTACCYTKPPQSWYRLLAQRRRWGSNAFFNTTLNVWSSKIHPIIRISSVFDLIKMFLVFFRLFSVGLFFYNLSLSFQYQTFLTQMAVLMYPTFTFLMLSLIEKRLRKDLHKILIGLVFNRLLSGLVSVGIMATMFYNIGNFAWGPSDNTLQKPQRTLEIYSVPILQFEEEKSFETAANSNGEVASVNSSIGGIL